MAADGAKPTRRILAVVVVLVLLAGAAELALRLILPSVIAGAVRSQLHLTADHPVDVSLGGSALLHAVTGRVGDVTIAVDDAPVGEGIVVGASLHADSVPFNPLSGEVRGGTARLIVSKEQLPPVVSLLTRDVAQTGEVRDGGLVVGRDIGLFGQNVPLTSTLELGIADGGAVEVRPTRVGVASFDLTADQISELTGGFLDPILKTHVVCVRDRLPVGIDLTGIELSTTGSVNIDADLAPGILSDAAQREPGTCS